MSFAQRETQLVPSCPDHELVVAVRGGNDRAFEELYGRYGSKIRAYVLGMVGDHGRAEDVTQDVFISALRRLRATERPIVLKPWLYEIARNACIDEFRRRGRAHEVSLEGSREGNERFVSWAPPPEAAIENKQRLDDLRGAFRGLSENHHRIMVMRELEGLSYGEIGERMGMSKPVVESNLFRARRRLHAEYDDLVSGRRCEQVQTAIATGSERPVRSLGARERRQLARHLSHCQPCRRAARMASVDESWFHVPGLAGKIAALLPFPWLRLRLRRGARGGATVASPSGHSASALRPVQAVAQLADPSGPASGLGRAATAVAAIVVAGAGGGIVVGLNAPDAHHRAVVPSVRALSPAAPVAGPAVASHEAGGRVRVAQASRSAAAGTHGAGGHGGPVRSRTSSARSSAGLRTQKSAGATAPSRSTGTAAGALATTGKLGGAVLGGSGLLGASGSNGTALPKLPSLGLPSTPTPVANTLNGSPSAPPPDLGLSNLPVPSLPRSDPGGLLPPLGYHSG
ncbi:MAG: RNA polymerase sigma factor [Solirubrobacteraceae bacterium]